MTPLPESSLPLKSSSSEQPPAMQMIHSGTVTEIIFLSIPVRLSYFISMSSTGKSTKLSILTLNVIGVNMDDVEEVAVIR